MRWRVLLPLLFIGGVAIAQERGGAADPDIYLLPSVPSAYGLVGDAINSVTRSTQTVDTGVTNLILIADGQSNNCNVAPSAYTPTNGTALDQLNVYDGVIYKAADPQLGCVQAAATGGGPGHPAFRLADSLVTAGLFARVILVPIAINGTLVADHDTGIARGRLQVAIARIAQRGIVAGANVTIIVMWGQGESDKTAGTLQATYTASLNSLIAQTRTAGFNGTWFVAKQTYDGSGVSAGIQAAQAAVVSHPGVWAGPDADALIGSACSGAAACRQVANGVHWTDAGSISYAAAWKTALHAFGAPF